jgi:hypothetical protein
LRNSVRGVYFPKVTIESENHGAYDMDTVMTAVFLDKLYGFLCCAGDIEIAFV